MEKKMKAFYSQLTTGLLRVRLEELNNMPILTLQEGRIKNIIESVLRKRGEL